MKINNITGTNKYETQTCIHVNISEDGKTTEKEYCKHMTYLDSFLICSNHFTALKSNSNLIRSFLYILVQKKLLNWQRIFPLISIADSFMHVMFSNNAIICASGGNGLFGVPSTRVWHLSVNCRCCVLWYIRSVQVCDKGMCNITVWFIYNK